MSTAVQIHQLRKSFRTRAARRSGWRGVVDFVAPTQLDRMAVDGISFRIEAGERVAFIGPNGAGKSTTLKVLTGILKPDSGETEVLGFVPWRDRTKLSFHTGAVFGQRSQLWYHLPTRDTFDLLARVYELSNATYQSRRRELTETFELGALLEKPVRTLSLGERMRCEVAASLLHRPRVLFLDEPTIGLDAAAKETLRELLRRRAREDGLTLLLTSHDTADIESVCDRVLVIHRGRLLLDGPVQTLKQRLRSKRLTLQAENCERASELSLPGVRVLERSLHHVTLEVATDVTPIGRVLEALLKCVEVRDLSIEDPPLEAVIRALYAEAKGTQ